MTIPSERTRAIIKTQRFLIAMLQVPISKWDKRVIRKEIASCLRHYPNAFDFGEDRIEESFEVLNDTQVDSYLTRKDEETNFFVKTITKKVPKKT